jgi:nitrogen fixation protein NifU and related proteins
MSDLRDLYQEVILDHNRSPRNFGTLEPARSQQGHNPLCGDRLTLYLQVQDGRVQNVTFVGTGCAISKASASMMTEAVKGLTIDEAQALFDAFHAMLTTDSGTAPDEGLLATLGKLAVFQGVSEYPTRVKCATLAWHTMQAALAHAPSVVSTESET